MIEREDDDLSRSRSCITGRVIIIPPRKTSPSHINSTRHTFFLHRLMIYEGLAWIEIIFYGCVNLLQRIVNGLIGLLHDEIIAAIGICSLDYLNCDWMMTVHL